MDNPGIQPLLILGPSQAWLDLSNDERRAWLNNKLAALQEFQTLPNGVYWTGGSSDKAGDVVVMLWNLVDAASVEALINMMQQPDVREYFTVTILQGSAAAIQEHVWQPFADDGAT